jgi:hypothetical protein
MAFVERYAKRRIPLPGGRSQQLIVLRAQTFARQQPPETSIDMDQAAESASDSGEGYSWDDASVQQVRDRISAKESTDVMDGALRQAVVDELIAYLRDRNQEECVNYLVLRLKDLSASEIEKVLGLDARQRDYLQQRFKYHLIRFALLHRWELVHQWLDVDLERDLGLTPRQWESLLNQLGPEITKLVELKRAGSDDRTVAQAMGISASQVQKLWFKLLETAWEIRNRTESGTRRGTDE